MKIIKFEDLNSEVLDSLEDVIIVYKTILGMTGRPFCIAGGAVRACLEGTAIIDVDVYHFKEEDPDTLKEALRYNKWLKVRETKNSSTFEKNFTKIDVVNKTFEGVDDIFENFDIRACKVGISSGYFWADLYAEEDIKNKHIHILEHKYNAQSYLRILKYLNKGYAIDPVKFLQICKKVIEEKGHDQSFKEILDRTPEFKLSTPKEFDQKLYDKFVANLDEWGFTNKTINLPRQQNFNLSTVAKS